MDQIKDWLFRLGITEAGPSAIRAGVLAVFAWTLAKNNALAPFGIVSDAVTRTTVIHWDQVKTGAIALLPVLAALIKAGQFHGTNIVNSLKGDKPQ